MMDAVIATERPTRLVLLGHPVAHSLSPIFQNAALSQCGIESRGVPVRYETLDVTHADLPAVLHTLAEETAGGNVTIPHKEAVAARAQCSALASRVGAVNTFWHERGLLVGHNTDVGGAMSVMSTLVPDEMPVARCVVFGAGGSAAAVLVALDLLGCRDVCVVSRDVARATELVARVASPARVMSAGADALRTVVHRASLVINTTPIGLSDDAMPTDAAWLSADAAVFDLVYRPASTPWVRACLAADLRAVDGLSMLLEQGAAAFECWFGIEAPRETMRAALQQSITTRI